MWPLIFEGGDEIDCDDTSYKWRNAASHNAGGIVIIVGISTDDGKLRRLFSSDDNGEAISKQCENINAYLVPGKNIQIEQMRDPLSEVPQMLFGNMPRDGGNFILSQDGRADVLGTYPDLS